MHPPAHKKRKPLPSERSGILRPNQLLLTNLLPQKHIVAERTSGLTALVNFQVQSYGRRIYRTYQILQIIYHFVQNGALKRIFTANNPISESFFIPPPS